MSRYINNITSKIFLTVMIAMLVMTVYFIGYSYYRTIHTQEQHTLSKLEGISRTLAYQINGDRLQTLLNRYPLRDDISTIGEDPIYHSIHQKFERVKRANNLSTDIYTITYDARSDAYRYGVSSSPNPYYRHIYRNPPDELMENYMQGGQIEKYKDENGTWISAFTPIENSEGNVVAVIQVDQPFAPFIEEARMTFFRHIGFAVVIFAILAVLVRRFVRQILHHESISKKKLEEYLRLVDHKNEELEQLEFVISKSDNLILLTSQDGTIEWVNESYQRKNNFSPDELKSFKGRNIMEVSQNPRIQEVVDTVVRTRDTYRYRTKSFGPEGEEFWASTTVTPIFDKKNDTIDHLLFIDSDITELKQAEREIEMLAKLPMENTNPVMRVESNGKLIFFNDAARKIVDVWDCKNGDLIPDRSIVSVIQNSLDRDKGVEMTIESKARIYRLLFTPVVEQGYVNIHGEDITEQSMAEEKIRNRTMELEELSTNLTDSLTYARSIQEAIVPSEDSIRKFFRDAFVLNQPRDIVSGDFYWIHEIERDEEMLVASVDCTGHGVPGAMMSIIAHSLLTEIVEKQKIHDPATILEKLNKEIIEVLRQKEGKSGDGMDMSICRVNKRELKVTFAGAYRPVLWMNGKLNELKGDRHPIGGLFHDSERSFQNQTFKVSRGDCIYLFSDGFTDQFGGPNGKKFMIKRFREMIKKNYRYSMQAQSYLYQKIFENWKGSNEQVDDVSMVGIRF